MTEISAVIITFNEEANIKRCLDSLLGVVDEIVVVDSFSSDRTKAICEDYDLKFIEQRFLGYVEQKNFALSQATHDYVLSLDADEALSPELHQSIKAAKPFLGGDAYRFSRLSNYAGFWVHHCGWYPDRKIRLFRRSQASWGGDNPHDKVILKPKSELKTLSGDLLHYSYPSISDHIQQTNRFSTIAAQSAFDRGVRSTWITILSRPVLGFFRDYFLRRGILDGKYGFIICFINALAVMLKYAKISELEKNNPI